MVNSLSGDLHRLPFSPGYVFVPKKTVVDVSWFKGPFETSAAARQLSHFPSTSKRVQCYAIDLPREHA